MSNRAHLRTPVIDRVFAKLEWQGECLVYVGGKDGGGYGNAGEQMNGKWKSQKVHRVVYSETIGPIPERTFILHSCDRPACANPEHLRPGTQTDNMRDMMDRGRCNRWQLTKPIVHRVIHTIRKIRTQSPPEEETVALAADSEQQKCGSDERKIVQGWVVDERIPRRHREQQGNQGHAAASQ